jgi:hypothetical protein
MNRFALLFRQGSRPLSAADLQNRSAETTAWAQTQNAAGHQLDPHILDPESRWVGPNGGGEAVPAGAEGPVTAILFLEARDIAEAVEIARAHPATRYGSSIEVRPWAPPAPRSTAPAPPR